MAPASATSAPDPGDAERVLAGAPFRWWIAGGWALDLFAGAPIRPRKDVDIAVLRDEQHRLRAHLPEWRFEVAVSDRTLVEWLPGTRLDAPLHEIWASPAAGGSLALEFLINESAGDQWLYRRDRRVSYSLATLTASRAGDVPVLPPEIVLLYKAKHRRPEDERDFDLTLPLLAPAAFVWLAAALDLTEPGHPWSAAIQRRR